MRRSSIVASICLLLPGPGALAGDTTPPTIVSGCVHYFVGNPEETAFVDIEFSEPLNVLSAIAFSHYFDTNTGISPFEATYFPPNMVRLQFTERFYGFGTCEQVRATKVKDLAGNEIVDDGVGNVVNFYLYQIFMRAHMERHMQEHDDPPHSFGWEGDIEPLSFTSLCDRPLFDGNADSLYTSNLFFCLPCTTATSGPEPADLQFKFSHQCSELESIPNRFYPVDLAFQPDGVDTLELWWDDEDLVTGAPAAAAASGLVLEPGRPNPASAATSIAFTIPAPGPVTLDVHDVHGTRVRRLASGWLAEGRHERSWDGRDGSGRPVASGIYFVRLRAGDLSESGKVVLKR